MSDASEINRCFANVLISLRRENEFSQEVLAEKSNLDRTYISLLERGLRQPTMKILFALAESFQVSPHKIVQTVEEHLTHH
jgi:transcriptional regulator with XRE-family HTH domain